MALNESTRSDDANDSLNGKNRHHTSEASLGFYEPMTPRPEKSSTVPCRITDLHSQSQGWPRLERVLVVQ